MSARDGGPAYPVSTSIDPAGGYGHQTGNQEWQFPGMSLRQAYKIAALSRILSSVDSGWPRGWAAAAGEVADACLAEDAEHEAKERGE